MSSRRSSFYSSYCSQRSTLRVRGGFRGLLRHLKKGPSAPPPPLPSLRPEDIKEGRHTWADRAYRRLNPPQEESSARAHVCCTLCSQGKGLILLPPQCVVTRRSRKGKGRAFVCFCGLMLQRRRSSSSPFPVALSYLKLDRQH